MAMMKIKFLTNDSFEFYVINVFVKASRVL